MTAAEILDELDKRLAKRRGKTTLPPKELAKVLGISLQTINNWRLKRGTKAASIANVIMKALDTARLDAEREALKPIVEFFRIKPVLTTQGKSHELFATKDASTYRKGLRDKLDSTRGIYIFYDSRGRALYSGKTKSLTLWKEMNNALNRDRGDVQSVFRVTHPEAKGHFAESGEKIRQIRSQGVKLHDMAVYVSAYEVASGLIDTFESVLIRSFANDLLNVKMEKFGGEPQKPNTKVKKKLLKKSP